MAPLLCSQYTAYYSHTSNLRNEAKPHQIETVHVTTLLDCAGEEMRLPSVEKSTLHGRNTPFDLPFLSIHRWAETGKLTEKTKKRTPS